MPKPVIFIPGFPASELHDANSNLYPPSIPQLTDPVKKAALIAELINVPGDVIAGLPIASILGGIVNEAQSVYNILRDQFGYDITPASTNFIPIGWDWRQSIGSDDTVGRIRAALDKLSPTKSGNVVAILHSTGGLVFRAFLEQHPEYAACFDQVLTFGIPWAGTLEAVHAVTKGVSIAFLFITLLSSNDGRALMQHAQAAYDLFPTDPNLGIFLDANGNPTTPLAEQTWVDNDVERNGIQSAHGAFPRQFDTLPLTNVCGWGAPTWTTATSVPGDVTFAATSKDAGDGTVPFVSSTWLQGANVRTMLLPIGAYATGFLPKIHGQLWDSPPVLQLFAEVLSDKQRMPFLCAAADSDQYLPLSGNCDVRIAAVAADGTALPNLKVNVNLDGQRTLVPMTDGKYGKVSVSRDRIQHNIEPDLYRFVVEFSWNGGSDKRAVLIHTA